MGTRTIACISHQVFCFRRLNNRPEWGWLTDHQNTKKPGVGNNAGLLILFNGDFVQPLRKCQIPAVIASDAIRIAFRLLFENHFHRLHGRDDLAIGREICVVQFADFCQSL